jgi:hypothetical protein
MMVAILGAVTGIICFLFAYSATYGGTSNRSSGSAFCEFVQMIWTLAASVVALWVFLWLATDLPTFIWRGLGRSAAGSGSPASLCLRPSGICAPDPDRQHRVWRDVVSERSPLSCGRGCVPDGVAGVSRSPAAAVVDADPADARGNRWQHRRQLGLGLYLPFHWGLILLGSILLGGVLNHAGALSVLRNTLAYFHPPACMLARSHLTQG